MGKLYLFTCQLIKESVSVTVTLIITDWQQPFPFSCVTEIKKTRPELKNNFKEKKLAGHSDLAGCPLVTPLPLATAWGIAVYHPNRYANSHGPTDRHTSYRP